MIIGIGLASGSAQFEVAFILTGAAFVIIFIRINLVKKLLSILRYSILILVKMIMMLLVKN